MTHGIKWPFQETYLAFIRKMYEEACLTIPEDFYPEVEAPRLANALRAQGMGIQLEPYND